MTKHFIWLLLCAPLLLVACNDEDDDDEPLEPVTVTTGTALAEPTTPTNNAIEPANAYDGSRVHLVYCQDDGTGTYVLKYTQRLGGGVYLAPADVFPTSTVDSRKPHITLDDNLTLHMVWTEGTVTSRDVYYATRSPAGTISAATNLTSAVTEDVVNPRVAVDSTGRVFVCWQAIGTTSVIQYTRTLSSSWTTPVILPASPTGVSGETPDICVDGGDLVYVFWSEDDGSSRNIRMMRSDDGGFNFGIVSGRELVVSGSVDMSEPRVASGAVGEVFLTFIGLDSSGGRAVFASKTSTGGQFTDPVVLQNDSAGGIRQPSIASAEQSDGTYVVMITYNDGGSGGGNILLRASSDSGLNYPGDPINLSQNDTLPAGNTAPAVAMDDNEVIVCWQGQPPAGGVQHTFTTNNSYQVP